MEVRATPAALPAERSAGMTTKATPNGKGDWMKHVASMRLAHLDLPLTLNRKSLKNVTTLLAKTTADHGYKEYRL